MDFVLDENFIKFLKPFGVAALGLAAVVSIAYGFNKYMHDEDQQKSPFEQEKSKQKPAGIYNQGNTCFVNSLLQALAPLKLFISNLQDVTQSNNSSRKSAHEQLLIQLRKSLIKINSENESVDIVRFLDAIRQVSQIINLQQQDAYELFSIILNSFEQVFNQNKGFSLNRSTLSATSSDELESAFINFSMTQRSQKQPCNSLLGYTKTSLICSGCHQERNLKIHPFYNLSFDISSFKIRTLEEAIQHFQEKQFIEGWACTKCSLINHQRKLNILKQQLKTKKIQHGQFLIQTCGKILNFLHKQNDDQDLSQLNQKLGNFVKKFEKQYLTIKQQQFQYRDRVFVQVTPVLKNVTKQCLISKFPSILVLHLKQLSMNPMTGQPMLLKKHIKFPKKLSIKIRNGFKNYQLVSLISHTGNQLQGHYFTFRKLNNRSQKWFLISDTNSMQCKEQFLKSHMPYMLFYQLQQ